VTSTLYPAICAVRERADLLQEAFVKSNRLALMWGVPFGVGLALFAPDLVEFVIGSNWQPAVILMQIFGGIAAINHIGFNWSAFYRARGETRPMAVSAVIAMVLFVAVALPLLVSDGLRGFGIGMAVAAAGSLAVRTWYLTRLFQGFAMLAHSLRAIAPTIPAAAAVLIVRALDEGSRSGGLAAGELALYLVVTVVATMVLERPLLREVAGYIRGRAEAAPAA
jgi:PST family polysaccharide transporter